MAGEDKLKRSVSIGFTHTHTQKPQIVNKHLQTDGEANVITKKRLELEKYCQAEAW